MNTSTAGASVFKIAKIVDEYTVVINAGSNQGINRGKTFEIYSLGSEVTDPDTGASLGTLDYVKAKIVATDVFPKMSVCKNRDQMATMVAGLAAAMIGKPVELNVAAEDISGDYDGYDSLIRIGDRVRMIEDKSEKKDQPTLPID